MENDHKLRRMHLRFVVPCILCLGFIVSACLETTADNVSREKVATPVKDAERVFGIAFEANAVTAKVMSTGCTAPEHFEITHEVREGQCYLTLVRNKPDFCRRVPFAMDVIVPFTPPAACSALPVAFDNEIVDFKGK